METTKIVSKENLSYVLGRVKSFVASAVEAAKALLVSDVTLTGTTLKVTKNGKETSATIPVASATQSGTVKVGAGLAMTNGVLSATGGGTADSVDWEGVQNKPTKVSEFTNDSGYQTAAQVTAAVNALKTSLGSVLSYKGSKATFAELPSTGNTTGDVYNVVAANGNIPAGTNYAWDGAKWDALGGEVDLSGLVQKTDLVELTTDEIDEMFDAA